MSSSRGRRRSGRKLFGNRRMGEGRIVMGILEEFIQDRMVAVLRFGWVHCWLVRNGGRASGGQLVDDEVDDDDDEDEKGTAWEGSLLFVLTARRFSLFQRLRSQIRKQPLPFDSLCSSKFHFRPLCSLAPSHLVRYVDLPLSNTPLKTNDVFRTAPALPRTARSRFPILPLPHFPRPPPSGHFARHPPRQHQYLRRGC